MLVEETQQLLWIHELYRLGQSDLLHDSPTEVLDRILRHIVAGFQADSGSLTLCQGEECECLTIVAGIGLPPDCIGTAIRRGSGIIGWVAESGQALLLNGDVGADPRFQGKAPKVDTFIPVSSMCWPLLLETRVLGALCVNSKAEPPIYTDEDLEYGRVLVNLIALVIDNARLHIETHRRIRDLALLNERYAQANRELEESYRKLQEVQKQLLQSEKMASIGLLAAGVAHEVNNPIGYVNSNLLSLKTYVAHLLALLESYENAESAFGGAVEELRQIEEFKRKIDFEYLRGDIPALLDESLEGAARVKKIVQDLKDFSHAGDNDVWEAADLHKCLESALNIVRNEIKYKARVVKEFGALPSVQCLPLQLTQVFLNLLINAAHAIETEGTITVRTGAENGKVWVEIGDTGKGIKSEHLDKIFDPFFTTKPVGQGTGLGLSVSYSIIRKHKGEILVDSSPGRGATFRVVLPVRQDGRAGDSIT
jgi:signal transduction histidine kinase